MVAKYYTIGIVNNMLYEWPQGNVNKLKIYEYVHYLNSAHKKKTS